MITWLLEVHMQSSNLHYPSNAWTVSFTNQNDRPLEKEDKLNLTLVIDK